MASEGGSDLEAIGAAVGHLDLLDAVQSASAQLSNHKSVADVAQAALTKAIELTKSSVAFLALADDDAEGKRVFSMADDPNRALPEDAIERILDTTAALAAPMTNATWDGMAGIGAPAIRSTCAQSLQVSGRSLGMIGVASPSGYTAVQQKTFAILANQVAAAIAVAQLGERRQAMIDTLVNLRADLDRSERQRLINEERAMSAERVERAHEAAVDALPAVARHARREECRCRALARRRPAPWPGRGV